MYEYRHNVQSYIPLVTGSQAPFNDTQADMARYYHSLGLYFPCRIGQARVLLIKSGLHLDYDGPQCPIRKLITEIVQAVKPTLFITTGTGGAIGTQVALGDVVLAGHTRFDCTQQFKSEPWATASYQTSPLPAGTLNAIVPALSKVNAERVVGGRPTPEMWAAPQDTIVTTDFFGFDDSSDHYKLQGLGQCCDMGDAMIGNTMQQFPNVKWHAIRNASDPQIPNPDGNIQKAAEESTQIYSKYGVFTTAASVIATWAVIQASFPS
jgi:nucleoside phosphorylase